MIKRVFDIVVSAVGLALLLPAFAIIALAITCSSSGPVLYRQRRIGRGGQPFCLYKFRTMYVGEGRSLITVEGDPRITPLGRVLRRWKLDEVPQLWNVLCGDMSVVGPRPEVEPLVRYYTPEQQCLLEHTPGLAGVSQLVYPHEADLLRRYPNPEEVYRQYLMPRKLAVDLQYGRSRTFWSDLRVLAELTLLILLRRSFREDRNFRIPMDTQINPYGEKASAGHEPCSSLSSQRPRGQICCSLRPPQPE